MFTTGENIQSAMVTSNPTQYVQVTKQWNVC